MMLILTKENSKGLESDVWKVTQLGNIRILARSFWTQDQDDSHVLFALLKLEESLIVYLFRAQYKRG